MKLTVINSNSTGNGYLLETESGQVLMLECGVAIEKIKQAVSFNLRKVIGCLVTHEHKDHCRDVQKVIKAGIDVYASFGTHAAMGTLESHRAIVIEHESETRIGEFMVKAFKVKHDAADPFGYLIYHKECGQVLFLTDTYYSEYLFSGLNNLIIEANFCEDIIKARLEDGETKKFLRDRIYKSHMSLQTCKGVLRANNLTDVNNIVLIHLSDSHSDEVKFKREVEQQTGKLVYVARPGLIVSLDKRPF